MLWLKEVTRGPDSCQPTAPPLVARDFWLHGPTSVFQTERSRRKLQGKRAGEVKKVELSQKATGRGHFCLIPWNCVMWQSLPTWEAEK